VSGKLAPVAQVTCAARENGWTIDYSSATMFTASRQMPGAARPGRVTVIFTSRGKVQGAAIGDIELEGASKLARVLAYMTAQPAQPQEGR
jgi:hypothetical protein